MKLPKFVLADNTDYPDNDYVIHLEYPMFIVNLILDEESDEDAIEVEFLETLEESEESEIEAEMESLIKQAQAFYEREMDRYDEEFDELDED